MTDRRLIVAALVVAVAAGFWLGSSPSSPVNPNPPRPVLTALARAVRTAARLGLWIAVAGEKPPAAQTEDRQQLVRAPRVDAEGHPVIDHREGW